MDSSARIVLVEDDAMAALDVARRLRRLGYQVVAVASSGP
jgi:CheY-like chemotaxis protein